MKQIWTSSWSEFKQTVAQFVSPSLGFTPGARLFRGHGNTTWPLTPTFDRIFGHYSPAQRNAIEKSIVDTFRSALASYPEHSTVLTDDNALLSLGQHFGLRTRLLDWTGSPYVAAYFALRDHVRLKALETSMPNEYAAVFVLDRSIEDAWASNLGVEIFTTPRWQNIRLRNQDGWFTRLVGPHQSIDSYLDACKADDKAVTKIMLPAATANEAIVDLSLMQIDSSRLFPDLTGVCDSANLNALLWMELQQITKT